MSVRKMFLAVLCSTIALGTAERALADQDWHRHDQPGWNDRQEWRERQEWRQRQAWREQQWREHEWREQQSREQHHGFPFAAPSRNYTPPPLYYGNPGYLR